MPIPIIYRKSSEAAVNYDYTDISEGTGTIVYNGFNVNISGAVAWFLSKNASIASDLVETSYETFTFNLSAFNLPMTIKGTVIIRFSGSFQGVSTGSFVVYLQKVSNGAAVTINSAQTKSIGGNGVANCVVNINVTSASFKKGDNLRVVVNAVPFGIGPWIAHDPLNRDGTFITPASTYPTKFEVLIPYKLDI